MATDKRASEGLHAAGAPNAREPPARILVVDDEPATVRAVVRQLEAHGYTADAADSGEQAASLVTQCRYDAVLTDISMPGLDGIGLLRSIHAHDPHIPVVLITGQPSLDTAVRALECGAFHYLTKPAREPELLRVVGNAVRARRLPCSCPQTRRADATIAPSVRDAAALQRAIRTLWVAYHPIVSACSHRVSGYEALARTREPSLSTPRALVTAAEALGRTDALGRAVRAAVAADCARADGRPLLFVNVRPSDLVDPALISADAPLSKMADLVVLEVTERASIEDIQDMDERLTRLREMGYRIAVNDLGAGYAGLTSFARVAPEFVKLDRSLVRDVHRIPIKQKVVRSVTSLAHDMGMQVVAEGIESIEERDCAVALDCDLLQGFHFARPAPPFPAIQW